MTREEEIRNKSYELGQRYFPDANNVWARANIEAQYVSSACMEIAQWADRTMLERAKEYLENNIDKDLIIYYNNTWKRRDEFIKDFIRAMKGGVE